MPTHLSIFDRPDKLKERIDIAYNAIHQEKTHFLWTANGSRRYGFRGISEHDLFTNIIAQHKEEQKEFYFLDIGSGEFKWGRQLADTVNKQFATENITVHIFSLTGENMPDILPEKIGCCILHDMGNAKIEELGSIFPHLTNQFDGIISQWCFRHLADPVGTFVQAYDLLKPMTGYFLFDGFFFQYEQISTYPHGRMFELLFNTGSNYIVLFNELGGRNQDFVLQKNTSNPLKLPLNYIGMHDVDGYLKVRSNNLTMFGRQEAWKTAPKSAYQFVEVSRKIPGVVLVDEKSEELLKSVFSHELLDDPQIEWPSKKQISTTKEPEESTSSSYSP